jgi:hypothetical protein
MTPAILLHLGPPARAPGRESALSPREGNCSGMSHSRPVAAKPAQASQIHGIQSRIAGCFIKSGRGKSRIRGMFLNT